MDEVRGQVQDLDDTGIVDAGRGLNLLDHLGAVGSEEVEGAPVSGHHRAADVANSLALGLEVQACGGDVPLVEAELFPRRCSRPVDDEEGQAAHLLGSRLAQLEVRTTWEGACSDRARRRLCVAGNADARAPDAPRPARKNEVSEDGWRRSVIPRASVSEV